MKRIAVMAFINQIEDMFPVETWYLNGIPCWPGIRRYLFDSIIRSTNSHYVVRCDRVSSHGNPAQEKLPLREQAMFASKNDAARNQTFDQQYDVVITGCLKPRNYLNGVWYDRQVEPIIDLYKEKGLKCLHLEFKTTFPVPRHTNSCYTILDDHSVENYKAVDGVDLGAELRDNIDKVNEMVIAEYPKCQPIAYTEVIKRTLSIHHYADYFYNIFLTVRPRIGFVACYTSSRGFGFNMACHRFGVSSVAVQHGAAAHINPANGHWPRIPEGGYTYLPKVFWCWDAGSAEFVDKWNDPFKDRHKTFIGGDLWLKKITKAYPEKEDDRELESLMRKMPGEKFILWTFQHELPKDVNFMKMAPKNWVWWIRLHPLFYHLRDPLMNILTATGVNNFLIDEPSEIPIYSLFRYADAQFTLFSSAVLEAIPFRLYSVVNSVVGEKIFITQIKEGLVKVAYSNEVIIDSLIEQIHKKGTKITFDKFQSNLLNDLHELLSITF